MWREHCQSADSGLTFQAGNYGVTTRPRDEWAYVLHLKHSESKVRARRECRWFGRQERRSGSSQQPGVDAERCYACSKREQWIRPTPLWVSCLPRCFCARPADIAATQGSHDREFWRRERPETLWFCRKVDPARYGQEGRAKPGGSVGFAVVHGPHGTSLALQTGCT
eukprot:3527304-Rhodomonas_salina.1